MMCDCIEMDPAAQDSANLLHEYIIYIYICYLYILFMQLCEH